MNMCLWITAAVVFLCQDQTRVKKTYRVENCSYILGCDLLEKMIEATESTKGWSARTIDITHKLMK